MSDFIPKSLDDIDSEFLKSSVSAAPPAAKAEKKPEIPAVQPVAKAQSAPDVKTSPKTQSRETLIPTPIFYKAAPMQAPLPDIDEPDYIPIGRKKVEIADISGERTVTKAAEYSPAPSISEKNGMSAGRKVLAVISCIMLAVTILVCAFFGVLTRICDKTAYSVNGYYVCSVRESTVSPILSSGDVAFVKGKNPEDIKSGDVVACLDKESKTYYYGVVDEILPEETGNTAKIKTEKTYKDGEEAVTAEIPQTMVLGTADYYFPGMWKALSFVSIYFNTLVVAAVLLTAVWILLLVGSFKFFPGKEQDDD